MARALIGLGANLGDRVATLEAALARLTSAPEIVLTSASRWHETQPIGGPVDQPAYLNGAAVVETSLAPRQLLLRLHAIERELGRERTVHWGPRTVDLDLLLYDDSVVESPELAIPHPRLGFRRFALVPAAEVAADWRHPLLGWNIRELLLHLDASASYIAITGVPGVGKSRLAEALAKSSGARLLSTPYKCSPSSRAAADSTGPNWEAEIEFLASRGRLLANTDWPRDASLVVSDFWLGQSLAYGLAMLAGEPRDKFRRRFAEVQSQAIAPRLIVWLDAAGRSLDAEKRRADAALAGLLHAGGHGPILKLSADARFEEQFAELSAALAAMK